MRKSEIAAKIEYSIKEIADQFIIGGGKAFYFRNESDIQCRLFACISKNIDDTELVHAEQRIENSGSWHDLAIWKPEMKATAVLKWKEINSDFAVAMPNLNLAVVEIKHLYGRIDKAKKYVSCKSICSHQDIQHLVDRINSGCKYAYFVMFWDEDVKDNQKYLKYYHRIRKAFTTFRRQYKRIRILCKTRDGLQFSLGF